jgi:hypothetical protein
MKLILGTIAAAALFAALYPGPAEARCRQDAYGWHCSHPTVVHHHQSRLPSPSWGY